MVKKIKSNKNIEIGTLIENFDDKITFIAEQVVAIKETQDTHTGLLSSHDQRLGRIEMRLDRVDTRLDNIETKLDKKADKEGVAKLSQRVVALETKT